MRHPLVELDEAGLLCAVRQTTEPDREPFTEFRAGILIAGLSRELFEKVRHDHTTPLDRLLPPLLENPPRCVALLTGLDYAALRLTAKSRYEQL